MAMINSNKSVRVTVIGIVILVNRSCRNYFASTLIEFDTVFPSWFATM